MLTYDFCTALYDLLVEKSIHSRFVWNKGIIMCNIFEDEHGALPDNLEDKLKDAISEWVSDTLPEIPPDKVTDLVRDAFNGTESGTVKPIVFYRHFEGARFVIDLNLLREVERDVLTRWKAKKFIQAALQACPMYEFLSIRDVIFLTYTETGESVSWRKASKIMKLYEDVQAVKRNGHLKTKGRQINLPKARAFLREWQKTLDF
jgi:hypothetical protein